MRITLEFFIVIAVMLALIALFLFVRVRLSLELREELTLTLWIFGIKISILPKKQKKYKLSHYTPRKIARRDAKKAKRDAKIKAQKEKTIADLKKKKNEKKKLKNEQKKAKKGAQTPIMEKITLFSDIASTFFSGSFERFHFHIARIKIAVGANDAATAAIRRGWICAALGPVILFLDKYSNLHGLEKAEIDIYADYLSDDIDLDLKVAFSMSLGMFLWVLIKIIIKYFVGAEGIKPQEPDTENAENLKKFSSADSADKAAQSKSKVDKK